MRPARTRLTSHPVPATRKGGRPAQSEPMPPRAHRAAPPPRQPATTTENRRNTISNRPRGHPESSRLIAVAVSEYDPAISFFVDGLGFELVEDSPALANDGRPKRWVVVRPPGAATGLLLARADGEDQAATVGKQAGGRVGFFLHVEDFDVVYGRMASAGVQFLTAPRTEPYGRVAVFLDIAGNKWDLIGPVA
jgi:catechol 2,3-dioxygenase-like lactoylglutathione lyase family enzyme